MGRTIIAVVVITTAMFYLLGERAQVVSVDQPMLQAYPELKGSLPVEKIAAMAATPPTPPKDHLRR